MGSVTTAVVQNYGKVFKKDTIIIPPYFGSLLRESVPLSKAAKNHAQPLRL